MLRAAQLPVNLFFYLFFFFFPLPLLPFHLYFRLTSERALSQILDDYMIKEESAKVGKSDNWKPGEPHGYGAVQKDGMVRFLSRFVPMPP